MTLLLAGDIGGTKTLLSLVRCTGSTLEPMAQERFLSAEWPELGAMLRRFLSDQLPAGATPPAAACLAVAGPVRAGRAQLTNLSWHLEEGELAAASGIPRLELVNDFAVLIDGLPHLQPEQQTLLRAGEADPTAPVLVVGAGTGLGVALGVPVAGGLQALASEAAHAEFAPRTEAEWQLKQWLRQDLQLERVSIERVVSGTGLGQVFRWLLSQAPAEGRADENHRLTGLAERWAGAEEASDRGDLPAAVAEAAQQGDPLAREALTLWLEAYGSACGDLALACLPGGGIWLAGGTAGKLVQELGSTRFLKPLLAKGRLGAALQPIPVRAITDPAIGSYSAACRARRLLAG